MAPGRLQSLSLRIQVLSLEGSVLVTPPFKDSTASVGLHFEPCRVFCSHAQAEQTTYIPTIVLPSSCHVVARKRAKIGNQFHRTELRVTYYVLAELVRDNKVISKTAREIEIFDGIGPQPPTCISDFSREYTLYHTCMMRRRLFQNVGILLGRVEEPKPLSISGDGKDILTQTPLFLAFQREEQHHSATTRSLELEVQLTWRIKKFVFYSMGRMEAIPTVAQARKTPSIAMTTFLGVSNSLKFLLSGWKEALPKNDEGLAATRRVIQWNLQRAVPILVPASSFMTLTSFTLHVACRYSLLLQMKIVGHGKAHLKLVTPIQVVYSSRSSNSTTVRGSEPTERPTQTSNVVDLCSPVPPPPGSNEWGADQEAGSLEARNCVHQHD